MSERGAWRESAKSGGMGIAGLRRWDTTKRPQYHTWAGGNRPNKGGGSKLRHPRTPLLRKTAVVELGGTRGGRFPPL